MHIRPKYMRETNIKKKFCNAATSRDLRGVKCMKIL